MHTSKTNNILLQNKKRRKNRNNFYPKKIHNITLFIKVKSKINYINNL